MSSCALNTWGEGSNESQKEAKVHHNSEWLELLLKLCSISNMNVADEVIEYIEGNEVCEQNHEVEHDNVLSKEIKNQKRDHNDNEESKNCSL